MVLRTLSAVVLKAIIGAALRALVLVVLWEFTGVVLRALVGTEGASSCCLLPSGWGPLPAPDACCQPSLLAAGCWLLTAYRVFACHRGCGMCSCGGIRL